MSVVLNMLSCEWVVLVLFLLSLFGMRIYSFIVMNENVSVQCMIDGVMSVFSYLLSVLVKLWLMSVVMSMLRMIGIGW